MSDPSDEYTIQMNPGKSNKYKIFSNQFNDESRGTGLSGLKRAIERRFNDAFGNCVGNLSEDKTDLLVTDNGGASVQVGLCCCWIHCCIWR